MTLVNDLQPILAEIRIIKDAKDIEDIEKACAINAAAFNFTMSKFKAGQHEYEAEAMHAYIYLKHGSRVNSFGTIAASGHNASTLHFVNDVNKTQDGQTFLLDAGCEWNLACSDHTRTFPVGKKFTPKQEELYKIVLACNKRGIELAKPGVKWEDVHFGCLEVLLEGLRKTGMVRSNLDFKEQLAIGIPTIFQPHGLGHMLGLNTHDVGGYNSEIKKSTDDHRIRYLRTRRVLQEGMILTVEPGLYFIEGFLDEAKKNPEKAKHLNFEVIAQYEHECGGYRIEDDILITKDGNKVLPGPVKELDEIYALRAVAYAK